MPATLSAPTVCAACKECGAEATTSLGNSANRVDLCQSCAESKVVCCQCGEVIDEDDCQIDDSGGRYCESCYSDTYTRCAACGCEVDLSDAHSYDSDYYCESCFDERYRVCEHCGDTIPVDDCCTDECGDCYCESCYSDAYTHCEECGREIAWDDAIGVDGCTYCERVRRRPGGNPTTSPLATNSLSSDRRRNSASNWKPQNAPIVRTCKATRVSAAKKTAA